jgi:NAD(P)-dependent dehydrogenase (short-subunit alcohol dehydrogenase family)
MSRLKDKKILITGASRGLGRALALEFAREGAKALVITARDAEDLRKIKTEIAEISAGTRVTGVAADLSNHDDIERLVAGALSELGGRLDVLINNASILGPTPMPFLLDYPLEDFRSVLNVNLIAPFLLIKKLLPAMIEAGGSIVNVTSDAGRNGYPGWGAYGISKFGIEGLSETWAAELEETDVRINWVDPGNMHTAMHRAAEPDEDPAEWADPRDVTDVFVYLASDESKGVSGKRFEAQEENWGLEESSETSETASGGH